jgi:hypothetical protein
MNYGSVTDPVVLSRARSGGWSARVPIQQGQQQPSPGPQAWFRGDAEPNGEPRAIAQTYTIRFGVKPPSPGANATALDASSRAIAIITNTVAGSAPITRKVSIGYGTAMTLTCESATIGIWDETPADEYGEGGPLAYAVDVQVSPGERAGYLTPPTYRGQTDVVNAVAAVQQGVVTLNASGGAARYPIDPGAGAISIELLAVDATDPSLTPKITVAAMVGATTLKIWNPFFDKGFVLLPPGCTYVEVTNHSTDAAFVTATFGIEG